MQPVDSNWQMIAGLSNLDAMRAIDINVKIETDYRADVANLRRLTIPIDEEQPATILDFGAGMLRNTLALRSFSSLWNIVAYDSADMLNKGVALYAPPDRVLCTSSWADAIKQQPFKAVVATIVLQHLPETSLREALADFASISPWLCIWGRQRLDESAEKSVWRIVAETWDLRWGDDGLLGNREPESHGFGIFRRRISPA